MFNRGNSLIIIALCTGAALIAFAFDQRYGASISAPAVAFYAAAAIICLLPLFHALFRCQTCRNKTPNAGLGE